jgi:hypothetical protein
MSRKPRLTKDDLEAWRVHPVTEVVHQYLRDYAQWMREQWAEGENWTVEAKFQVQNFEDLAAIDLDAIETFYDMKEDPNEQDSEG